MQSELAAILLLCLLQCEAAKGTVMRMSLSNYKYNDVPVEPYNLLNVMGTVDGKLYILMHDDGKNAFNWYRSLTGALRYQEPSSSILQFYWQRKGVSLFSVGQVQLEVLVYGLLHILNVITDVCKPSDVVLIGHGLGALINGIAAREYKAVNSPPIGRIIALDPERNYYYLGNEISLNKNDAQVVMVIHTVQSHTELETEGTIEFFPNGGIDQSGCGFLVRHCGISRSPQYLTNAIMNPTLYQARKCFSYSEFKLNSCANIFESMGNLHTRERGLFYLDISQRIFF